MSEIEKTAVMWHKELGATAGELSLAIAQGKLSRAALHRWAGTLDLVAKQMQAFLNRQRDQS